MHDSLYERVFAIKIFSFVYLYLRLCIRTFVFLHRSAFVLGCVFVHRYVFVLTYTSARGQPHPYHSVPGWSSAVSRTPHSQHRPLFISNPFPAPLVFEILYYYLYFILLSGTPHICALYPPMKNSSLNLVSLYFRHRIQCTFCHLSCFSLAIASQPFQ